MLNKLDEPYAYLSQKKMTKNSHTRYLKKVEPTKENSKKMESL